MAEKTGISWTDHTFNGWSGCHKISAGCAHCYAADLPPVMRRRAVWGRDEARIVAPDAYWAQPLAWARAAKRAGVRRRVFAHSTSDVFEDRADLDGHRDRLMDLIRATPDLDWLLLTKRAQKARDYLIAWAKVHGGLPRNLWAGVTVEDQRAANERVPYLLQIPAVVRFVSCEPLVGPVDFADIPAAYPETDGGPPLNRPLLRLDALRGGYRCDGGIWGPETGRLQWVISGGESGRHARPSHPEWYRSLRDQCAAAGVPFHHKQWGAWIPRGQAPDRPIPLDAETREMCAVLHFRGDVRIPADYGVRRLRALVDWHGKNHEHHLDGVEHLAFPEVGRD